MRARARACDGVAYMPPGLTPATADAGISHSCVTSSQTAASQGAVGTSVGAGGGKSPRKQGVGWGWGIGGGGGGLRIGQEER